LEENLLRSVLASRGVIKLTRVRIHTNLRQIAECISKLSLVGEATIISQIAKAANCTVGGINGILDTRVDKGTEALKSV
jgi:hypothetical protein